MDQSENRSDASEHDPLERGHANEESPLLDGRNNRDVAIIAANTPLRSIKRHRLWLMGVIFVVGIALMTADAATELAAYVAIGSAFQQLRHVSWLTISYNLTVTLVQPLYSRISDIYGRRPLLLFSYVVFGLGIVISVLSQNFWLLCAARGIVGIGSAGMGYMVALILNDLVPIRQRSAWQGGLQAVTLLGQLMGGGLGGLIVEKLGWRIAFLLELPFSPLLLVGGWLLVKLPSLSTAVHQKHGDDPFRRHVQAGRFDLGGSAVLLIALSALLLPLNLGGNDLAWSHPVILILLIFSLISFGGFGWIEQKSATMPLVPMDLLFTRALSPVMVASFLGNMMIVGVLYLQPYYIHVTGKGTSTRVGIMNALVALGDTIGQLGGGGLIYWRGRPWTVGTCSAFISVVAFAYYCVRWHGNESIFEDVLPLLLSGISVGSIRSALLSFLLKATSLEHRAIIYGVYHIFSSIGTVVSISSVAGVLQNRFAVYMHESTSGDDIDKIIQTCLNSLQCLSDLTPSMQQKVRAAFVRAIGDSFFLLFALSLCMLITMASMQRIHIDNKT